MKTLIADDEPLARERLKRLLEDFDQIELIGEATTGGEVLEMSARLRPDLLFLDIRMPEMDGLEAAKALSVLDHPPAIVFTTAYDDHALEAFETHAVAYLLKPIRKANLELAVEKAGKMNRAQLRAGSDKNTPAKTRSHLSVRSSGKVELIPIASVYYFQAEHKYVKIRHRHGEDLTEETLKSLAEEFSGQFTRIHRNALVSNQFLIGISKHDDGRYTAKLKGLDERLDISRRHLPSVRKLLKQLEVRQ